MRIGKMEKSKSVKRWREAGNGKLNSIPFKTKRPAELKPWAWFGREEAGGEGMLRGWAHGGIVVMGGFFATRRCWRKDKMARLAAAVYTDHSGGLAMEWK